ncbi:MAG: arylamine N-acetyltransferase [Cytophagaceae bacterium]|nr:arylamine N-acetyltransferase [Gemmatimonadaceae bacterium]
MSDGRLAGRRVTVRRSAWLGDAERDAYFARIGYHGPAAPTLETLFAIHRAHLHAIPYENLDIHLGRTLVLDPQANFHKLVYGGRGGWCYEMNGVLGAVLQSLGYDVRYLSGTVGRERRGDAAEGNHLVLLVTLDQPWVVDVGFGDGFLEPIPLVEGTYRQGFLQYGLVRDGERWTVLNHPMGSADRFDFTLEPRFLENFAAQCHELQTSPESGFVQHTVCQRFVTDGLVTLRGAVLREIRASGVTETTLGSAPAWGRAILEHFGLAIPGVEGLFPGVWERHLAWAAAREAEANAITSELPAAE